ncbi:MAG: hypothetical protein Q8O86_02765 [Dehalococcoidia bacterium]|nr:hypothetical protein [Dehalococcoidia bacterium]
MDSVVGSGGDIGPPSTFGAADEGTGFETSVGLEDGWTIGVGI